jgi:hypothetical protein
MTMFGQNLVHDGSGWIETGAAVRVTHHPTH